MKYFIVFATAMAPVLELRAAIPLGYTMGLSPLWIFLAAVMGNMLPVPFIILLIRQVFQWLRRFSWLGPRIDRLEQKAHLKGRVVQKYRVPGLILLVAIPLPGTGAWTGALVAALFDIRLRDAIPSIFLGVLIAGAIMTGASLGVVSFGG